MSLIKKINGVATLIGNGRIKNVASGAAADDVVNKSQLDAISKNLVSKNELTALNATGTITAAMVAGGGISSTSAAGVTATLDTATLIANNIGATRGTSINFIVDNTAGANTVTVVVGTGIVAATPIITGGDTLTVAASATQGIGLFKLVFSSATAAVLYRMG